MEKRITSLALVSLGLVVLFSQSDCARNPVTGKRQFVMISEAQEIAIGKESHPQVLAEFGRVEGDALQNYVNGLGQALAGVSHRPELEWHFTVVDSPVVNAFALPGGYIYVTRQLLSYMNNEAELAGVLGHEIGHVTARHSVSQISKAQLMGLAIGVGGAFSQTFRQFGQLAELGTGLLFLKFGREAERESDELGVYYMLEEDFDAREMSRFFEVFQRMREESGRAAPSWMETHPVPAERIVSTREIAEDLIAVRSGGDLKVNRQDFLRQLENVVFGDNPREGFQQDGHFYHPELRFQIDYPQDWTVINSKSSVLFVEPEQKAGVRLTLVPPDAGGSTEQAARYLSEESGVAIANLRQARIHGNPASLAHYRGRDSAGNPVEAFGAFISYGNQIYQLLGMGVQDGLRVHSSSLHGILQSFRSLSDSRLLNVQPDRLRLYRTRQGETLRRIAENSRNERVTADDLGALNRIDPDHPLSPGTWVKVVSPGR